MPEHVALALDSLDKLDMGVPNALFKAEIAKVTRDLDERPNDKKPRTVTVKFALTPVVSSDGRHLDEVALGVEVSSSMPKARTKTYRMLPKADGSLVFSPDLPDDPRSDPLFPGQGTRIDTNTGEVKS